jgi:hypothetical protein
MDRMLFGVNLIWAGSKPALVQNPPVLHCAIYIMFPGRHSIHVSVE